MRLFLMSSLASLTVLSLGAVQAAPTNQPDYEQDGALSSIAEAIMGGKANLTFRYRFENVDQVGFANDANASTLRTRLKYTTGDFNGFTATVEFDNVTQVGADEYNSTVNGATSFPVVADPEITEVNQAYLAYKGFENVVLMAGRVALNFNNQRFVGTVGWRQNDQTWDMAGAVVTPTKDLKLTYGYVWNVNRIFGDDHPFGDLKTNTHIFNAEYEGFDWGKLTAYGLAIDLKDAPVFGLSSQTWGVRFEGKRAFGEGGAKLLYEAEVATQSDYQDNPNSYRAGYYHLSGGVSAHGWTGKIGFESLGSDNGVSFQTPLATLHKFNGWADKFLTTPVGGLDDVYVLASYKVGGESPLKGVKFDAVYHDFSAQSGGLDYGTELDLQATKKFGEHYYAGLKYADYNADSFATDTKKIWFTLGANF